MLFSVSPRQPTAFAALLLAAIVAGCTHEARDSSGPSPSSAAAAPGASIPLGETWDVILMQGSPLGYMHTVTQEVKRDERTLLQVQAEQRMTVQRFGDQAAPGASFTSVETPDGQLVSFESQQQIGPTAQTARGEVRESQLILETTTTGKTETSRLPWSDRYGGLFALEHSLLRQPLKPGEQRKVQALAPVFNQLATYELTAKGEEETKLLDGKQTLLRIEVTTSFADGNSIRSTVWTDAKGEAIKTRTDAFSWETYRTTKERAMASGKSGPPDLGLSTVVRLAQPLQNAHQTRRVRYEVTIAGEPGVPENNPAKVFPNGPLQQVKAITDNMAELIVTAARPASGPEATPQPPPLDAEKQPSNLIQSDNPLVVQMAREGAGQLRDQREIALALERYVKSNVRNKNFTQALATAADVAQTREGDCTEHAVLLAALARANGIPARVAIGLVYVDAYQGFGYHMWDEVYLDGAWLPLDATLGRGGIGAGHIKLAHTSLASGDAFTAFLPVAQVLGRLKIKVLEAE